MSIPRLAYQIAKLEENKNLGSEFADFRKKYIYCNPDKDIGKDFKTIFTYVSYLTR